MGTALLILRLAARDVRRHAAQAALLVVAIAVVVFGIVERRQNEVTVAQWTEAQAIPEVAVLTPKSSPAVAPLVLPGNIQAWYEAPMYARVSGYLKMWYFDYGAHVKAGEQLAVIDTPVIFQVSPAGTALVGLTGERWSAEPDMPLHHYTDLYGNPCTRAVLPAGRSQFGYGALATSYPRAPAVDSGRSCS